MLDHRRKAYKATFPDAEEVQRQHAEEGARIRAAARAAAFAAARGGRDARASPLDMWLQCADKDPRVMGDIWAAHERDIIAALCHDATRDAAMTLLNLLPHDAVITAPDALAHALCHLLQHSGPTAVSVASEAVWFTFCSDQWCPPDEVFDAAVTAAYVCALRGYEALVAHAAHASLARRMAPPERLLALCRVLMFVALQVPCDKARANAFDRMSSLVPIVSNMDSALDSLGAMSSVARVVADPASSALLALSARALGYALLRRGACTTAPHPDIAAVAFTAPYDYEAAWAALLAMGCPTPPAALVAGALDVKSPLTPGVAAILALAREHGPRAAVAYASVLSQRAAMAPEVVAVVLRTATTMPMPLE
jgi:predicted nucleic acid-binding protein